MPSIMLIYDRPTDVARRSEYNGRVRDWIARLLQIPGVVSLLAQRAVDGAASPNTIVTLEFRKLDQAQAAISSEHLKTLLRELGSSTADCPKAVLVERSPFTPVPIRPET